MSLSNRLFIFLLVACIFIVPLVYSKAQRNPEPRPTIRIAHTDWSSSVASANLVKAVLQENLGINCELLEMSIDLAWEAVAKGDADAMLSAWLPDTHDHYYLEFGDHMNDLGPNLIGTRTGLVVPDIIAGRLKTGPGIEEPYVTIDSIDELPNHARKFNNRIIGIEPEAGIMHQTQKAMDAYSLHNFEILESSEAEMIEALSNAIYQQQWVVITGWMPHWSFARWNLKFLDDPQNIYGGEGRIHTMARAGLEREIPEAFDFLDNFHWTPAELNQLMMWIENDRGRFPYDMALRWQRTNPHRIQKWLD